MKIEVKQCPKCHRGMVKTFIEQVKRVYKCFFCGHTEPAPVTQREAEDWM